MMGFNFYFSRGRKSIVLNWRLRRWEEKFQLSLGVDCSLTLHFRRPMQLTNLT